MLGTLHRRESSTLLLSLSTFTQRHLESSIERDDVSEFKRRSTILRSRVLTI